MFARYVISEISHKHSSSRIVAALQRAAHAVAAKIEDVVKIA
jgi:hypothetical protein